jgi:CubicO group peptidase (beta-lactamase class C family)
MMLFFVALFHPVIGEIVYSTPSLFTHQIKSLDDDFDSKIEEIMKKGHMPSLVACIIKDNITAWSKGYGYYDYYNKKKTTVDIVYPIASVTKSFTATAIMQIIENESYNINLDDNVSEYLPFDLKNPKYPEVNITYRMLLAHQSSLGDTTIRFIFLFTILKISFNLNTYEQYLVKEGLFYNSKVWNDYRPGEGVCYSTQGTDLLGLLIEQITGQSYTDYCQGHIFEPLKMYNTSFYFSDYEKEQLTHLYIWIAGFYLKRPYIQQNNYAGGALKTTISDFSRFLIMHTSGGTYDGVRILSKESVEEMHSVQYPGYYDDIIYLHGLGWYQHTSENETYGGHGGNFEGARAEMKMRYSDRVGVAYFWNQNSFLRMQLKRMRPEERAAAKEIKEALFEKADEL